jgi:phage terminase small subunit
MTPEQIALLEALTPLQRAVCTRVAGGMAQREAYMAAKAAAGRPCTPATADAAASRMLAAVKPAAFLRAVQQAAVSSAIMEKEEAMAILTRQARTSLSDLVEWARYPISSDMMTGEVTEWQTGWRIKPSVEQDPEKMALISELTAGKEGIKIKTHSQREALQLLGKFRGWEAPTKIAATNGAGDDVVMPTTIRLVGPDE